MIGTQPTNYNQKQKCMQTHSQLSSHSRVSSPEKLVPYQPPLKKRRCRRWCDIVEIRALENGVEDDAHRIAQRQKQIDYGKNTIAYDRFNALHPRESRARGDPMTPLARQKCSKRSFAGQITSWKKQVYAYVAKMDEGERAGELDKNHSLATIIDNSTSGALDRHDGVQHQENIEGKNGGHTDLGLSSSGPHNEDDDSFSDMDDIELDDLGNVVGEKPTPPVRDHEKDQTQNTDVSPASIFDAF